MNAKEHDEHLIAYIERGDRNIEPVFVGRDDLFDQVDSCIRGAQRGFDKGRTVCFYGPPGIGKTAFLSELAHRKKNTATRNGANSAIVVKINPAKVTPFDVLSSVIQAVADNLAEGSYLRKKVFGAYKELEISADLKVLKVNLSEYSKQIAAVSDRGFPWKHVEKITKGGISSTPIILCIDEAQNILGSDGKPGTLNSTLSDIHDGTPDSYDGSPVITLCAGLGDTPEVLNASISAGRFAREHLRPMKKLTHSESVQYVLGIIDYLGLSGGKKEKIEVANWVASEGNGWPHHLQNAMTAIAKEARQIDDYPLGIDQVDYESVSKLWSKFRDDYYESRLKYKTAKYPSARKLISELFGSLDSSHTYTEMQAVETIENLMKKVGYRVWIHDQDDLEASAVHFFSELQHYGLIGQCRISDDLWECPISSMKGYLNGDSWRPEHSPPKFRADEMVI